MIFHADIVTLFIFAVVNMACGTGIGWAWFWLRFRDRERDLEAHLRAAHRSLAEAREMASAGRVRLVR